MPAAVVPFQIGLRHVQRQAVIEEAVDVHHLVVILRFYLFLEEGGGRELTPVPGDDRVLGASEGTYGLACGYLRGFVEDYQVELGEVHGDVL